MFKHQSVLDKFASYPADHLLRYVNNCNPNEDWPRNILEIVLHNLANARNQSDQILLNKALTALVERGVDINRVIEHVDSEQLKAQPSLLQYSAYLNTVETSTLQSIVALKPDINVAKDSGLNPIVSAVSKGDHITFNYLYAEGLRLNSSDADMSVRLLVSYSSKQQTLDGLSHHDQRGIENTMVSLLKMHPDFLHNPAQRKAITDKMNESGLLKISSFIQKLALKSALESQEIRDELPEDERVFQGAFANRGL